MPSGYAGKYCHSWLIDGLVLNPLRGMHSRVTVLFAVFGGADAVVPVTTDLANVNGALFESDFRYHYLRSK